MQQQNLVGKFVKIGEKFYLCLLDSELFITVCLADCKYTTTEIFAKHNVEEVTTGNYKTFQYLLHKVTELEKGGYATANCALMRSVVEAKLANPIETVKAASTNKAKQLIRNIVDWAYSN